MMTSLTVIVPVYNEENLVIESLKRLDKVNIVNKVIIVDDGNGSVSLITAGLFVGVQAFTATVNAAKIKNILNIKIKT